MTTTTLDDVTKKIKPEAEHPAEKTVLTESVGEVAWCRKTGPGTRLAPATPVGEHGFG